MQCDIYKIFNNYNIKGIATNTKNIKRDYAFIAIKGKRFDGNDFIDLAFSLGATIVFTDNYNIKNKVDHKYLNHIIYVDNLLLLLSTACNIFYKVPKYLIGITGTNGKTSVAYFCYKILDLLNIKSGYIGTLGIIDSDNIIDIEDNLTTPDFITFRSFLNMFEKKHIDYVAFEASSHALDQHRIHGIELSAAAFTSFSHDHLEYHKNLNHYLNSKLKLFIHNLKKSGIAIINSEIQELTYIKKVLSMHSVNLLTVGYTGDIKIEILESNMLGQLVRIFINNSNYTFFTHLLGKFQIENLVIAIMLVHKMGFDINYIISIINRLDCVPGRMERVTDTKYPFHIFIDYAHTPDALLQALYTLKKLSLNKIIVLFGCGGDRDHLKRPLMGNVSMLADRIIVTDDNPRHEDSKKIRQAILSGIDKSFLYVKEIPDRREAIEYAVNSLQDDDILLVSGKGHEKFQIIGDEYLYFNDKDIIQKLLFYKK